MLEVEGLTKRFGGLAAVSDASLEVREGEIVALIGPNGAGKTTLIAQLTGALPSDSGTVHFAGRNITSLPAHSRSHLGLARSFQITSIFLDFSALDNVALAPHVAWLTSETLCRSIEVAVENCHRLRDGEALLHRVC